MQHGIAGNGIGLRKGLAQDLSRRSSYIHVTVMLISVQAEINRRGEPHGPLGQSENQV